MSRLRVVLDSNVLVSATAYPSGTPGKILAAWKRGSIELVLCDYILNEVRRTLPRLSRVRLEPERVRRDVADLEDLACLVAPIAVNDPTLRDPADQPILGTFLAANADYLITGDKDLLALAGRYPILTPAAFWERHGS